MRFSMRVAACAVLCLSAVGRGQKTESPRTEPWTVDDVIQQKSASGWALSRDGRHAIFIERAPDKKKNGSVSRLMWMDLPEGTVRRLDQGNTGVSSARLSPSARYVAFLSGRDFPSGMKGLPKGESGSQLWILDMRGGEAKPVTRIPHGVSSYQWVDDDTLILAARERRSRREARAKKAKDDSIVVEDPVAMKDRGRRLFRFEIGTGKLRRLTRNDEGIQGFELSPDGRHAVAVLQRSPSYGAEGDVPPRCVVFDLEDGSAREIYAERLSKPFTFRWRPDGQGFFALRPAPTVDGEAEGAIRVVDEISLDGLAIRTVELDHSWGITGSFVPTQDGFITGLCNGVRPLIARYVRGADGRYSKNLLKGTHGERIFSLAKARDADRVLYVTGSASDPDRVFTAVLDGNDLREERQVFRPNGGFEGKRLARSEVVRWKGALDEEVEGILYYPHDWDPEKKERRPLVLITHGGPHGADRDRFSERWANSPNLYAQRGAFVLKTNYHGSSDYGLAFGESIKGRYYELEILDMFRGIEMLIEDGKVDRDRLGLVGWSNGAILSIAALTLAHLYAPGFDFDFKACAPGAGDVNWSSDYGNCAFGVTFDDYYLGGAPWEIPGLYQKKSPLFHVERVTTPTIIFFGTRDTSVPTEQGWQWYRALHKLKKAPVRFVLFPGEPHGLRKLTHQRRKLEEELAWFDEHLFHTKKEDVLENLVEKNSPLDRALAARRYKRYGVAFGEVRKNHLTPEVVPLDDGLMVGRFEVTRAQWAEFKPESRDLLHPNLPVTGITGADAAAYARWLSDLTGETWRLPTRKEWKKLARHKGQAENTLSWWAGYEPAPSEVAALSEAVAGLGPDGALWSVGTSAPSHWKVGGRSVRIHDIGGNAAEWIAEDGGGFHAAGGSAVTAPDDRGGDPRPPADFIGFRLVRESRKR